MFGLPLNNILAGHEILSVTTSKNVTLTFWVGCLMVSVTHFYAMGNNYVNLAHPSLIATLRTDGTNIANI